MTTNQLVYTVNQANIIQDKVLSHAAIAMIHRDTVNGRYNDRANANEPPLMAPATDPNQYPRVCVNPVRIGWLLMSNSGVRSAMTFVIACCSVQGAGLPCVPHTSVRQGAVSHGTPPWIDRISFSFARTVQRPTQTRAHLQYVM